MFDKFRDECGVVAIYGHPEASKLAYLGLYALQHRGQESAGMCTSDGERIYSHKSMGHVADMTRSRIPTNWAAIQTQLRRMRRNSSLNRVMVAPPFVCGIPHRFLLSQVPKSGPGAPGFCADSRRGTPAFCGGSWLHLQSGWFGGGLYVRLVHGSSLCRADGELAGVDGLQPGTGWTHEIGRAHV